VPADCCSWSHLPWGPDPGSVLAVASRPLHVRDWHGCACAEQQPHAALPRALSIVVVVVVVKCTRALEFSASSEQWLVGCSNLPPHAQLGSCQEPCPVLACVYRTQSLCTACVLQQLCCCLVYKHQSGCMLDGWGNNWPRDMTRCGQHAGCHWQARKRCSTCIVLICAVHPLQDAHLAQSLFACVSSSYGMWRKVEPFLSRPSVWAHGVPACQSLSAPRQLP
jgi:hypothetical protein